MDLTKEEIDSLYLLLEGAIEDLQDQKEKLLRYMSRSVIPEEIKDVRALIAETEEDLVYLMRIREKLR